MSLMASMMVQLFTAFIDQYITLHYINLNPIPSLPHISMVVSPFRISQDGQSDIIAGDMSILPFSNHTGQSPVHGDALHTLMPDFHH